MRRFAPLVALLLVAGCVPDETKPDRETPADVVRDVFSKRIRGDGTVVEDAVVTSVTSAGIEWGEGRRLAWSDVDDVESQVDQEKPAHPETLYVYLKRGAPSVATSRAEQPPLSGAEVVRCYVLLRDRAPGSRARLVKALRALGRAAPPPPPPPQAAPPPPRTTEEKLARLKELHDKGLITDEVYREEQKKVLAEGY